MDDFVVYIDEEEEEEEGLESVQLIILEEGEDEVQFLFESEDERK